MFLTSRDYALRLALSLVIASEAALFALLLALNGNVVPHISVAIVVAAVALFAAARSATGHAQPLRMLGLAATALVAELASLPSRGTASMLLAGLQAAHVLAGMILVAWTLVLPRWRRAPFARLTRYYWYFIAIAWLVVSPVIGSTHRP